MGRAWAAVAAAVMVCTAASCAEIFVSADGNDGNDGSKDKPLATLPKAQELARQKRRAGEAVTVWLSGGTYYLSQPLVFTAEDSGTKDAPVVWAALGNEQPAISGGVRVTSQWAPYKNGIMQADVPAALEGRRDFDQLFFDGRRQVLARYPNYDANAQYLNGTAADVAYPDRVATWKHPAGAILHAMHKRHWGSLHYRVTGVEKNGRLALEGGWQVAGPVKAEPHPAERFIENVFEELDAPGEWYLNREQGTLFFLPPTDADLNKARIELAGLRHLVELRGSREKPVRYVTFKGLMFTHTARTFMDTREPLLRSDICVYRGGAVVFEGTEDCSVRDSFFDQVGGNAVMVSGYNRRAEITGCKISEAGAGGISFIGRPDAVRLPGSWGEIVPLDKLDMEPGPKADTYPADCVAHDNLIFALGRFEKQAAAVAISMSRRIKVSHNSIYRMPQAGICVADGCWGGHVIEYNDVFDCVRETSDRGPFISWGRDRFYSGTAQDGKAVAQKPDFPKLDAVETTVIRNNRFGGNGWDIDLDDGSSNYHVRNNLCLRGGIKLREGYYRLVENNILLNNTLHAHHWYDNGQDVFVRNIVHSVYRDVAVRVWGKEIDFNLLPNATALTTLAGAGRDLHSLAGDPMYVNPAKGDYRVKEDSPALTLGFENFPMDQFGVAKVRLKAEAKRPEFPQPVLESAPRAAESRRWLGAEIKDMTDQGEQMATGMDAVRGVLVKDAPHGSSAAQAGLRQLDVIVECDGRPVGNTVNLLTWYQLAAGKPRVSVGVFRGRLPVKLEVETGRHVLLPAASALRLSDKGVPPPPFSVGGGGRIEWTLPGQRLQWSDVLAGGEAGGYEVWVTYDIPGNVGVAAATVELAVADQKLSGQLPRPKGVGRHLLGTVQIAKQGKQDIVLRATNVPGPVVANLQSVELVPLPKGE
ncbi:MAG: PDZ domain-containing protein [Planctomycetota bacterium]|nr:PDZ domain-containing protein [Planctomycetota bacterium]